MKHFLEDILYEESDFSLIKSNKAILDYGLCGECDIFILTEDLPRSLILNICDDIINWTCVRRIDKRGILYCSYNKNDISDLLLLLKFFDNDDDLKLTPNTLK